MNDMKSNISVKLAGERIHENGKLDRKLSSW